MRKLWVKLEFSPTTFVLEDDQKKDDANMEKPDTKREDIAVTYVKVATTKPQISEIKTRKKVGNQAEQHA